MPVRTRGLSGGRSPAARDDSFHLTRMARKSQLKNPSPEWLVVGLGNPGPEYRKTRHNVGFWAIDHLASHYDIKRDQESHGARWGVGSIEGSQTALAVPQTFMNLSGGSVADLVKAFDITPASMIIVHDDLDLPVGRLRLVFGASSGGHRGVASVIETLGSQEFHRLRIGIGRPPAGSPKEEITEFVLSPFVPEEALVIRQGMVEVDRAIVGVLKKGKGTA